MKNRKGNLYLLYRFNEGVITSTVESRASYQVVLFFSEIGEVTRNECKSFLPENCDFENLLFHSKEDLMHFSQTALKELDFSTLFLLAANDFNIGIESCHDLSSFREVFNRYGHEIKLSESEQNSKNIFGKFF